jgi:hypothetical protein
MILNLVSNPNSTGGAHFKYTWNEYEICLKQLKEKAKIIKLPLRDMEKALFITSW